MKKVILNKEQLEQLWCVQELSLEKIALKLQTSVKTVRKNIQEYNLSKEEKIYTKKEWLYQKHFVEKLNGKQMAKLAETSFTTIKHWMTKNNLKFDKEISTESKRKYTEDTHFFDFVDTEEKAYWLGFLMADGCISKTTLYIRLSTKDKVHIKKFLSTIKSDRNISDYEQQYNNEGKFHKMSRVDVSSFHLINCLRSYGFTGNKSMNEVIPEISRDLIRHYIRGYYDGDGSFSYGITKKKKKFLQVSILGGESFLNNLKKILNKEGVSCNVYKKKDRETSSDDLRVLMIHHNQALHFLDYIYEDSTIYLDRKYKKHQVYLKKEVVK